MKRVFFFRNLRNPMGQVYTRGYTHLGPSRDRFFHASPCSISISDEITYFSIVGNTPRDFLLVFFLFLGKGKENSKGYMGPQWAHVRSMIHGKLSAAWFPGIVVSNRIIARGYDNSIISYAVQFFYELRNIRIENLSYNRRIFYTWMIK